MSEERRQTFGVIDSLGDPSASILENYVLRLESELAAKDAEIAHWKETQEGLSDQLSKANNRIAELEKDRGEDAIRFFYWWHNQPGANTEQGYAQWVNEGKP